ncbi:hypothetical protein NDN08_003888 [Rhodosorus marinus]|uniref:Uncharacterized protein n=1 Tax=Rhodosorus marinus TaxID=101924 RepID=A0AAV8UK20_9RHOD|nr:hypothetical protein NDN08_003888 [Rhodosorus marinus]
MSTRKLVEKIPLRRGIFTLRTSANRLAPGAPRRVAGKSPQEVFRLVRITKDASIVPVDSDDARQAEPPSGKFNVGSLEADGEDPTSWRNRALLARTRHFFRPRGLLVVSKPAGLPSEVITRGVVSLVEQIPRPSAVHVDYEGQPTVKKTRIKVGKGLGERCEGLLLYGFGAESTIVALSRHFFPLKYRVTLTLGLETSNFEANGQFPRNHAFEHVSKENFLRELEQAINVPHDQIRKLASVGIREWGGDLRNTNDNAVNLGGSDIDKLLAVSPSQSNRELVEERLPVDDRKDLDFQPEWGAWEVSQAKIVQFDPPNVIVDLSTVGDSWRPMFHLIARRLGTYATMTKVVRTGYGPFHLSDGVNFSGLQSPGDILAASEAAVEKYSSAYGDQDNHTSCLVRQRNMEREMQDLYARKKQRRLTSKLSRRQSFLRIVEETRKGPYAHRLKRLTRHETLKGRESSI